MNPVTFKMWGGGGAVPANVTITHFGSHLYNDLTGNTLFIAGKNTYNQDTYESTSEFKYFGSDDLSTFDSVGETAATQLNTFLALNDSVQIFNLSLIPYKYGAVANNTFGFVGSNQTIPNLSYGSFQLPVLRSNDSTPDSNFLQSNMYVRLDLQVGSYVNVNGTDSVTVNVDGIIADETYNIGRLLYRSTDYSLYHQTEGYGSLSPTTIPLTPFKGQTVDAYNPPESAKLGGLHYSTVNEIPLNANQLYPLYSKSRLYGSYFYSDYQDAAVMSLNQTPATYSLDWNSTTALFGTPKILLNMDPGDGYTEGRQYAISPCARMHEMSLGDTTGYLSGGYYWWEVNQNTDAQSPVRFAAGTGKKACIIHVDGTVKITNDRGSNWQTVSDSPAIRTVYDTIPEVYEDIEAKTGYSISNFSLRGVAACTPSGKVIFMPNNNAIVYSEDFGLNWNWILVESDVGYGLNQVVETSDGRIYAVGMGAWKIWKLHDGTNWLGDSTTQVYAIAQGYGGNVWDTGLVWNDETNSKWYYLSNNGQGFTTDGVEPLATTPVAFDFVANFGFPAVDASFDTNNARIVHYMGSGTYAWTNIHNSTMQWVDTVNNTSVLYDLAGTDIQSDAIGYKWSAILPIGRYDKPGVTGEFFVRKLYDGTTWSDDLDTRDRFFGLATENFIEPTFTPVYGNYGTAPTIIAERYIVDHGTGYNTVTSFNVSAPDQAGGVQATISDWQVTGGKIYNIRFGETGSGYTGPITVTANGDGTGFSAVVQPVKHLESIEIDDPQRVLQPIRGFSPNLTLSYDADPTVYNDGYGMYPKVVVSTLAPKAIQSGQYAAIDRGLETVYAVSVLTDTLASNTGAPPLFNNYVQQAHFISKYDLTANPTFGNHITRHYAWDKINGLPTSFPRMPFKPSEPYRSDPGQYVTLEETPVGMPYVSIDTMLSIMGNNQYDSSTPYLIGHYEISGAGDIVTIKYVLSLATYDSVADQFTIREQLYTDSESLDVINNSLTSWQTPRWSIVVLTTDNANTWMYNINKYTESAQSNTYYYTTDAGVTIQEWTETVGGIPYWNDTQNVWVVYKGDTQEIMTSPNITGPWTTVATDPAGLL